MTNPRRPRCHLSNCQTSAIHRWTATFPLVVLRPQVHTASSPAALLRYATAEGEQEQLAAQAVSQALPAARALPLQAQVCQPPRVPESEGETQFEQALQSKSVPASQQSAASHAGREALSQCHDHCPKHNGTRQPQNVPVREFQPAKYTRPPWPCELNPHIIRQHSVKRLNPPCRILFCDSIHYF